MPSLKKAPRRSASSPREGWEGWDQYAQFYDWENARTLGRRDVAFWRRLATDASGPVLELGCGTGRISLPLVRAGISLVGIDRSALMLSYAARRLASLRQKRPRRPTSSLTLVRGDIRSLPFRRSSFSMALAPYGVLQSLLTDRALTSVLESVHHVLKRGGTFGIDLVPDVPTWREYHNRVRLAGRATGGARVTLFESVRQDRRRRLTIFEERYVLRLGRRRTEHRFRLAFRTLPVPAMINRLERAGFTVDAVLGDYRGRPWDDRAPVWILLARRW